MRKFAKRFKAKLLVILLGCVLGGVAGFVFAGFWRRDWDFSGWQKYVDITTQPIATITASITAVIAALITWFGGQKAREQNKEHELRKRFTSIVEMISSDNKDLIKRESGAYALAALADDWATFHKSRPDLAQQEQQVCLNILTSQLRDPIEEDSDPQLLILKSRVQDIIFSRFSPGLTILHNPKPGPWSNLLLDLKDCHLYNLETSGIFNNDVFFSNTHFHKETSFSNSEFWNPTDFRSAHFHDEANFSNIKLHINKRNLHPKNHNSSLNFSSTKFNKMVRFSKSIFNNWVLFKEAKFYSSIDFIEVNFACADFSKAEFHSEIHLIDVETQHELRFYDTKFSLLKSDHCINILKQSLEKMGNKYPLIHSEFGVNFTKTNPTQRKTKKKTPLRPTFKIVQRFTGASIWKTFWHFLFPLSKF